MDPLNSSQTFQWKYDVFLSFRGTDTRRNFTDHLYAELIRKGIYAYKDDKDLERGENIDKLLQAIKDSRFSIVIFSKKYATSKYCLDELVTIIECVDLGRHTVVPIFYDVDPFEVSEQTGRYGEAMKCHEESFKDDIEKVNKWRNALTSVADHSGWDLRDRLEVQFMQEVVDDILEKLRKLSNKFSRLEKYLVGLEKNLLQMDQHLSLGSKDVRMIGIYGLGGIGKTTIAKAICDRFSSGTDFEGSSFVKDIRERYENRELVHLQEQILSDILHDKNIKIWESDRGSREIRDRFCHKKVLIVLDDVSEIEHLNSLAGEHNWFGNGSRIIITTRDERLLFRHKVDIKYKVQELAHDEAVRLFYLHAFRDEHPTSHYLQLANEFIIYASGLPLALEVLGCFVKGRKIDEWKDALDGLKKIPNEEVTKKLEISFHGLGQNEKEIFLDIACFFKRKEKNDVIRILESCDFHPMIGLELLREKCLISISDNRVEMHDLLQAMGRDIVRKKSPNELGSRSRLWHDQDVYDVLFDNTGTKEIEGIVVQDSLKQENKHLGNKALTSEGFLNMTHLRLLKLRCEYQWRDLNYLPRSLKYLDWENFPFKYFPPKFQMDCLVELHMRHSKIQQFWKKIEVLQKLKVIDLSYSTNLVNTPNFTKVPNLKKLNLEGCINLLEVDKTIGVLQMLVSLNLEDCKKLVGLPNSIGDLKSLETLNLKGCSKISNLLEGLGNLTMLKVIDLSYCVNLVKTPDFTKIPNLEKLNLECCINLLEVDKTIGVLQMLFFLNLENCEKLVELPNSIGDLKSLEILNLRGCSKLNNLPEGLGNLTCLKELTVSRINKSQQTSKKPWGLFNQLQLRLGMSSTTNPLVLPMLSNLISLEVLDLGYCNLKDVTPLGQLNSCPKLESLHLTGNDFVSIPDLIPPPSLKWISLDDCKKLEWLPDLPSSDLMVILMGCSSLKNFPPINTQLHSPDDFGTINLMNCHKLVETCGRDNLAFKCLIKFSHVVLGYRGYGTKFGIYLPGEGIPCWFSNVYVDRIEMRVNLSPSWYNDDWMGFAFCASIGPPHADSAMLDVDSGVHLLSCYISGKCDSYDDFNFSDRFLMLSSPYPTSDHIWLVYCPRERYSWYRNCINGNVRIIDVHYIVSRVKVKECAFRLVYKQDIEELKRHYGGLNNFAFSRPDDYNWKHSFDNEVE